MPEETSIVLDASGSNDAHDPSTTLTYEWDFDGDGQFDDATGIHPTFSAAGLDGPGTCTVALRVTDSGGLTSTTTATIAITNVPPTDSVSGPSDLVRGQPRTFTLGASDPSPADQAAGFTFTIDWGDGSPVQTVTGPSGTTVSHAFAQVGSCALVTATDKDGGVSATAVHTVTVSAGLCSRTTSILG